MRVSLLRPAAVSAVVVALALALAGCSGGVASVDGPAGSSGTSGGGGGGSSGETPPASPPATAFSGAANGCGDVFTYRASADGTQFVTVQIDRDAIGMKLGETRSIDLADAPSSVKVRVELFARAPKEPRYCNDVVSESITSTTWTAEAGTLTVELGTKENEGGTFRATVRLKDVRVVGDARGTSVVLPTIEMKNVLVGWFAG